MFHFIIPTSSWWGHPHMIISRIAQKKLSSNENSKLNALINYGPLPDSTVTDCATWQDDLKSSAFYLMSNWHFVNIIINDGTYEGPTKLDTFNVTEYLLSCWETLTNPTTTDPWIWGFHLRSLIHFVGDIHTPHHTVLRYTKDFPNGDQGGNLYYLNCNYGYLCKNIHAIWDSAGNKFSLSAPTVPKEINTFESNVTRLMNEFHIKKDMDVKSFDPNLWAEESFQVVSEYGYATPVDDWPSDQYFKDVQRLSSERIVASGTRLGNALHHVLSQKNCPSLGEVNKVREITIWVIDSLLAIACILLVFLQVRSFKSKHNDFSLQV